MKTLRFVTIAAVLFAILAAITNPDDKVIILIWKMVALWSFTLDNFRSITQAFKDEK